MSTYQLTNVTKAHLHNKSHTTLTNNLIKLPELSLDGNGLVQGTEYW